MDDELTRLYNTKLIGDDPNGITFGQHKQTCVDGCGYCKIFRDREQDLIAQRNEEIAGLTGTQIQQYRNMMKDEPDISRWCPDKTEIYEKNGRINRDLYLVLQMQDFKDSEIREYFGINTNQWHIFKYREFPDWKENREDYLGYEAPAAYERWKEAGFHKYHNFDFIPRQCTC